MTDIKKGDRVKVTVEGIAHNNGQYTVVMGDGGWLAEYRNDRVGNGLTIEKIEEVFKPGDVVRHKTGARQVYFIRPNGGFANLDSKREYDYPFRFTSEHYERVNIE